MAAEHWEAVFVDTAVSPASVLRVKIPGLDNGISTVAVTWSPIGNALPAADDRALVVEADDGSWWAVSWWSAAQGATDMATQAELNAAVAGLPTRMVRGTVNADGSESSPDFSVVKNGTGDYTVSFSAFAAAPTVLIGVGATSTTGAKLFGGSAPTSSSFRVACFNTSTLALADGQFTFIACN